MGDLSIEISDDDFDLPPGQTGKRVRTDSSARFGAVDAGYRLGMEIGAFFILVLFVVVVAAIGGAIYAVAAKRRRDELGTTASEDSAGSETHPEHLAVENEQQSDFVGTR